MIKSVCLLLGICLIFICSQSVQASLPRKLFFNCLDGQQIPHNKRCDAHKDCRDGSDETFVECHKVICPELTCSYGGCYAESQLCDGNFDCLDKSDEHPEYCSQNATKVTAGEQWSGCENNNFKCLNSPECLALEFVCDGIRDCQDGSDETHEICLISKCTNQTFRCEYGGCLAQSKACDHLVHCWDKSDELPAICSGNGSLSWSINSDPLRRIVRTTPINTKPKDEPRILQESGCRVPRNLKNLQVKTQFNVLPYQPGVPLADSTVVRLRCLNNTELYGEDLNHCLDGRWQAAWPVCMETCGRKFTRDTSIAASCEYNGKRVRNCNRREVKLIPGTKAIISCAPSYVPKRVVKLPIVRICTKDQDDQKRPYWSRTSKGKRLLCVPDCGRILPAVKQAPWIVSLFISDLYMRNFTFSCPGYIISPWAVLVDEKFIYTEDVLRYAIAEGNHNVKYTESDEPVYELHSVASIYKSQKHALLELVNPFILSPRVRPICLPPIKNSYASTSNITGYVRMNGQDTHYIIEIEAEILKHTELININRQSNKNS